MLIIASLLWLRRMRPGKFDGGQGWLRVDALAQTERASSQCGGLENWIILPARTCVRKAAT